jgi:hypothetical protein
VKYRSLAPGGPEEAGKKDLPILILPLSADPEIYSISYPEIDDETFLTVLLSGRVRILSFDPVPVDAVAQLRSLMSERLGSMSQKTANRFRAFFSGGIAVAVLGIINWTVPDPLPLIDEGILSIGGLAAVYYSLYFRKNKVPETEELLSKARELLTRIGAEPSPLLSYIYRTLMTRDSIEKKLLDASVSERGDEETEDNGPDLLEAEVRAGRIDIAEIEQIVPVLDALMNLSAPAGIQKIRRLFRSRRASPLRSSASREVSGSALEVYRDIYSQAEEVLSARGKRLG